MARSRPKARGATGDAPARRCGAGAPRRGGHRVRARLAAARLGGDACRAVSRRLLVRRLASRAAGGANRRRADLRRRARRGAGAAGAARAPRRAEILARLDRDSGTPHRPAASLSDRLAGPGDDPTAAALWALHRLRLARMIERFRPAAPAPGMAQRDPNALRFAALLAAISRRWSPGRNVTAVWRRLSIGAAAQARQRRRGSTRGSTRPPTPASRRSSSPSPPREAAQTIVAPEGSALVVRAEGGASRPGSRALSLPSPPKRRKPSRRQPEAAAKPGAPIEKRWVLRGDGAFVFWRDGVALGRFEIRSIPAGTPTVALLGPPRANLSGSLTLRYSLADRYGIAGAEAEFAKPAAAAPPPRALVPPPKLALQLPSAPNGTGEASTTGDLSEHPWAGAEVVMTLKATGVSGHVGAAAPTTIVLPQRQFHNPLARALVEQRRALILDPDHEPPRIAKAINALTIAPELFQTPASVYLGLRDVEARLAAAHGDPDLLAVADLLWAMALHIEDGDASQAQRDLRAAEQRLREALRRGASEDEMRELTQELRAAAQRYLRDLAQQAPPRRRQRRRDATEQDLDSCSTRWTTSRATARVRTPRRCSTSCRTCSRTCAAPQSAQDNPATRNAQADRRTRQAAARPAGAARRDVPPRPARAARPQRSPAARATPASLPRRAPARAARPTRPIAAAVEVARHEGRERIRRRARRYGGGGRRPEGRWPERGPRQGRRTAASTNRAAAARAAPSTRRAARWRRSRGRAGPAAADEGRRQGGRG